MTQFKEDQEKEREKLNLEITQQKKMIADKENQIKSKNEEIKKICLLYTSPSPRDATLSRMPSSA